MKYKKKKLLKDILCMAAALAMCMGGSGAVTAYAPVGCRSNRTNIHIYIVVVAERDTGEGFYACTKERCHPGPRLAYLRARYYDTGNGKPPAEEGKWGSKRRFPAVGTRRRNGNGEFSCHTKKESLSNTTGGKIYG